VPARRLRNENWATSLRQVYERNGALEIALSRASLEEGQSTAPSTDSDKAFVNAPCDLETQGTNLIWRVRIVDLKEDQEIVVESPMALGTSIPLAPGLNLTCALVIGQNRWMFGTTVLGHLTHTTNPNREAIALRLKYPTDVERCRRRNFDRVSSYTMTPPKVSCWPLISPASAVLAEKANQVQIQSHQEAIEQQTPNPDIEQLALPEVGPKFEAGLANIGGGGIGLVLDQSNASGLNRHRLFWLRLALPPEIPVSLAVTARLVHTHIDSTQKTYAGMAFEFGHNKDHQHFIVDQLRRYIEVQQEKQLEQLRKAS